MMKGNNFLKENSSSHSARQNAIAHSQTIFLVEALLQKWTKQSIFTEVIHLKKGQKIN